MSSTDINREFVSFGNIAIILGILEIFFLLCTVIFILGGRFMWVLIIILLIVIMIFRLIAMGSLKKVNRIFNNFRLEQGRSKIVTSTILFFVGTIFFMVGISGLMFLSVQGSATIGQVIWLLISLIVGFILLFISGFPEYQGWDRIQLFFEENQTSFPPSIATTGSSSSGVLKIGGIMNITVVLVFIGSILRIIGYFKLVSLKKFKGEPPVSAPMVQPAPAAQPAPAPVAEPAKRFCPNCGSPITGSETYCGACGSEL